MAVKAIRQSKAKLSSSDPINNCRCWGHCWTASDAGVIHSHGLAGISLICMRCETERLTWVNPRSGTIYGRKYTYAAGYLYSKEVQKQDRQSRIERIIETYRLK